MSTVPLAKPRPLAWILKRSDTPKVIQDFLLEILNKVLSGAERDEIIERVREFKYEFKERPGWEKGSPKRVNNLTKYGKEEERLGKANMPGHVRAALNWNNLRRMNSDNYSMQVVDGMKTIVCKLRSNALGWTSLAIPQTRCTCHSGSRTCLLMTQKWKPLWWIKRLTTCWVCWTGTWLRPPTQKTHLHHYSHLNETQRTCWIFELVGEQ
jgi:hypothetical protein